jgi:hypothetical protein
VLVPNRFSFCRIVTIRDCVAREWLVKVLYCVQVLTYTWRATNCFENAKLYLDVNMSRDCRTSIASETVEVTGFARALVCMSVQSIIQVSCVYPSE